MIHSMEHWNGCQMCAIDIETTGLDPTYHEIIQIAIVPLTSDIEPRKDIPPFYIEMIPQNPELIDKKAMEINSIKLAEIMKRGHDQEAGKDLLMFWADKLGLPLNKGGINRCKIIPLGQNYTFDKGFIQKWLGVDLYSELFHHCYRDTMISAIFINDIAGMHASRIPHPKVDLTYLARLYSVERDRAHDALQDCLTTAAIYRKMIRRGFLGSDIAIL